MQEVIINDNKQGPEPQVCTATSSAPLRMHQSFLAVRMSLLFGTLRQNRPLSLHLHHASDVTCNLVLMDQCQ